MAASRRTQPYRKGSPFRRSGRAMSAMLKGRTAYGKNPMDRKRKLRKASALGKKRRRRLTVR